MLKNTGFTTDQIVQIKSLEAFSKAADGQATKIIIPSDIQNFTGLAAGIKEAVMTPAPYVSPAKSFTQCVGAGTPSDKMM